MGVQTLLWYTGRTVLVLFGLFLAYGASSAGVLAAAAGRNRVIFPNRSHGFSTASRRRLWADPVARIAETQTQDAHPRGIATSTRFQSSLGDPERAAQMSRFRSC